MILLVKEDSVRLSGGEVMQYIPLPNPPLKVVKEVLSRTKRLLKIKDIPHLQDAKGVIIRSGSRADGLTAAAYVLKQLELLRAGNRGWVMVEEEADDEGTLEGYEAVEFYTGESDDEHKEEDLHRLLYREDEMIRLPIVSSRDFGNAFGSYTPPYGQYSPLQTAVGESSQPGKPYWFEGDYPLVVMEEQIGLPLSSVTAFQQAGRFIIYVSVEKISRPSMVSEADWATPFEQRLLFDCGFEECRMEVTEDFYRAVLAESAKERGCTLSRRLDTVKVIAALKQYRGLFFNGCQDVELLVSRAFKKKPGSSAVLRQSDFDRVLAMSTMQKKNAPRKPATAAEEWERLVGLGDVKAQVNRLIQRLMFDKQRREQGLRVGDGHFAAAFLGNPGTAKTSAARIMAKLLFEKQILNSTAFVEVGRKELIGPYIGWTSMMVQKVWEQARGGVVLIDEAYSLLQPESFSEEAMAEIVRQIENDPSTLVLFAGYPDEMRAFIQKANVGIRSRLTNIIEFPDYTSDEMFDILLYLAGKEDYVIDQPQEAKPMIARFVERMKRVGGKNTGNGRLMRKLFKSAVGYKAERDDRDLKTLTVTDLAKSIAELENAELLASNMQARPQIGFLN